LRGAWGLEARLIQPTFIVVCSLAFATAFVLLAVLALTMRVITTLFPVRQAGFDTAVAAAISSTVSTIIPGARVVAITEIPCSSQPRHGKSA
jgi:hypothetical protein